MAARIQRYSWCLAAFLLLMSVGVGDCFAQDSALLAQKSQAAGWQNRLNEQQHALMNYPARICFIGDSLTEYWQYTGQKYWESNFVPLKAVNLGIAGDRTEHILYRLQYLDFSRAKLTHIVLMAGTNNLSMTLPESAKDVVKAIQTLVSLLQKKCPKAKIIVLGLPPNIHAENAELPQRVQSANRLLEAISWPEQVQFVSIDALFAEADGQWKAGQKLSLDGTHFSEKGYEILAGLLVPLLRE